MQTNTYKFEVTFKKDGEQTYEEIRAENHNEAIKEITKKQGDITIVSVSRVGN